MHSGTSAPRWLAFLVQLIYKTCYGVEDIPISSFGTSFYLTIPEIEAHGPLSHLVCLSSLLPASVAVTSHMLVPTNKDDDNIVDINVNKSGIVYNILQLTRFNDGIPMSAILFNITSDVPISVFLFMLVPGQMMANFQSLPTSYWGHQYVFIGLRNSHTLHVINIHDDNEILIVCKDDDVKNTIRDLKSPGVKTIACIDKIAPVVETKLYKVILVQGTKPFGLLVSYSSYNTQYTCAKEFFSLDMPTSTRFLSTEFFIVGSPAFLKKCDVVVMATQAPTSVTLARKGMANQKFLLKVSLSLIIISASTVTRKLTSSSPVQATLFIRSACHADPTTVGDISVTILVPTVLFYNVYFFGAPHIKDSVSQVIVFIHISGVATLIYNNEPIVNANWTRIVGAQNWLTGQTMVLQKLNQISSHVRFGCYVYSLSSSLGYIHAAGLNGFEQCETESNSSCVGNVDKQSISSAAFPKRNISSYGHDFIFVVGQGSYPNETKFYQVSMLILTTSALDIKIQIMTKYGNKYESESTVMTVKPKQPMVFNLSQYSEGVRKGLAFKDMVFKLSGTHSFSLSVVIETQNQTMASFMALPLDYWDKEYLCFGIRANPVIIAINLYFENTIDVHCGNTKVTDRISRMRPLHVEYISFCSNTAFKKVSGVSLIGIHEFGVIVLETTEVRNDSCSANGTFLGQDMTMPVEAFGKDFVTIKGHHKEQPGDLIVISVYDFTQVTLYEADSQKNEILIIRHKFKTLEIHGVQGGRRLSSSKPVQVMFVIRPTCNAKSTAVDVSYTLLMPDHLHYNEYYISNPSVDGVGSRLTVVIHNSGIYSLRTKNSQLSSSLDWEIVAGRPSWRLGTGAHPLLTSSHVTAEVFFACYVYSYKGRASSLQVAGYKSCLSLSVALRPEECYIYSIESEEFIAGVGERFKPSLWQIFTLLLVNVYI